MRLGKEESFADCQRRVRHMNERWQRKRIYFVEQTPSNLGIRYSSQAEVELPRLL